MPYVVTVDECYEAGRSCKRLFCHWTAEQYNLQSSSDHYPSFDTCDEDERWQAHQSGPSHQPVVIGISYISDAMVIWLNASLTSIKVEQVDPLTNERVIRPEPLNKRQTTEPVLSLPE